MRRMLTTNQATKTVKITQERHRAVRRLAADLDANIVETTDRVIEAGVKALRQRVPSEQPVSAN